MNLSVLEKMVRDGDMSIDSMRYLINCRSECEWLDYKEMIALEHDKSLCDFAKDVIAIKNVGGGYIIIGVEDKTWKPIGLSTRLPYDTKLLRDKVRRATGVDLDIDIVHHNIQIADSSILLGLIFIRSSRKRKKRRTPTLVNKDFCTKEVYGLRCGDIYVRNGDSTVKVKSGKELEDLLYNLEAQADNDSIILSGRISHFAIENGTYHLLEKGYEQFIGRTKLRTELIDAVMRDPRIWIINVHGVGGVGKSALVNWAVYEFYEKRSFEAILHLTAKDTILTAKGIEKSGRSLYSLENLLDHILLLFEETPPDNLEKKKELTIEYLSAWKTLIVLDNMETVHDGRILNYIQYLPDKCKVKVLITSRQKTGSWELPFPLNELKLNEVQEFLEIRSKEMNLSFPSDQEIIKSVLDATGGLPLAIQWLLGRYKINNNIKEIIETVIEKDSPLLEFSFRNIWNVLSKDAKAILSILSIFEEPPTTQQIVIATEFQIDRIEKALSELLDVTLVIQNTQIYEGRVTYVALPITLSFAQHQLNEIGDFASECRQRFQKYIQLMKLQESEIRHVRNRFEKFGLETDNEKRAAILCQKGESEMFIGNVDNAEIFFKQARDLAPQSAYIYAMSSSYEIARNRNDKALIYADEACRRVTKKTGALCYTIKARILDKKQDRNGRVEALRKALEYDPDDYVIRHQYGVALSCEGQTENAIDQFTIIIDKEINKAIPTRQLLMALKTRMINQKRLNREKDFQNDLSLAREIFNKYPHLTYENEHFSEFFEGDD
ncbi:MAG: putative DNA binding domain-containing protein [Nitrospirae bacterium]|nr:putative DNA binding domain-containing protein [Nitrospirota bacterium]